MNRYFGRAIMDFSMQITDAMHLYDDVTQDTPMQDIVVRGVPCFDTKKDIEEAFWKYYPDRFITTFGTCVRKVGNPRAVLPPGYTLDNILEYRQWTREDVRRFVESVSEQELLAMGY